ncbi:hypothetical protein [Lysinibacillus sp. G4S2]|uniref:hypothetical protein n=1 Tax=Lysinibacillus sp. G4S2 TaxID=3055859 RepID=UPI0025A26B07|nr:hypothetical protein [Lysinibacillus sp. G4S2]MDM5248904.1 hypothetical protein [Lysinibacillus sp. G4S2]
MLNDEAIAVELQEWMAPNDYMNIEYIRDIMYCYFKIWDSPGVYSEKIGVLKFESIWAVRFQRNRMLNYYPNEKEHSFRSYFLMVPNSTWLKSLIKLREEEDAEWRNFDKKKYFHYVIQNNDHYIEIISSGILIDYKIV